MYIKDLMTGEIRLYGTNQHDALEVSSDGRTLSYENLQNVEGSRYGDYRFCDKDGKTPEEDEDLIKHVQQSIHDAALYEQYLSFPGLSEAFGRGCDHVPGHDRDHRRALRTGRPLWPGPRRVGENDEAQERAFSLRRR